MQNNFDVTVAPDVEELRLAKLHEYKILDSHSEAPFNNIALIAAHAFKTPVAIVSLVDKYRVWYKASVGMQSLQEVPRNESLCSLVILQDAVTIFNDALQEPCLLANPFVAGDFGLRFYAGAPIKTPDGFNLGAVCVIDTIPRDFSKEDQRSLEQLAALVMNNMKLRLSKI